MTQTVAQIPTTVTITDFDVWCDFITDGPDLLPDNTDINQALADTEEVLYTLLLDGEVYTEGLLLIVAEKAKKFWLYQKPQANIEIIPDGEIE